MYPPNWPRCTECGDFAMDRHLTCGRVECDERGARYSRVVCRHCGYVGPEVDAGLCPNCVEAYA